MASIPPTSCPCSSRQRRRCATWAPLPAQAAAREAHASINSQLSQALASGAKAEVAAAVARALRVLTVQLKMLRMDAANFRLTMLADALKDGSGIR